MRKYWIVWKKSLKSETIYRAAALSGILSAALSFLIQVFLWKSLLGTGIRQDASFSDMLLYVLINSFMLELTRTNVASIIENAMIDGTISMELLRPISYKGYMLAQTLGKNSYGALTATLPVLLLSLFFLSGASPPDLPHALLFILSALLGVLLMFEVTYLAGLLAFWLQRCWFISFYLRGFRTIFGGTTVPIWFYPSLLKALSYCLPFRYMTFEPINLFLMKTPLTEAWVPLLAASLWLAGLCFLDRIVWRAATRRLTVNGG
ncbi:MAG: hypothetical protein HFG26_05565 [Provencibacterium sp.]|nr:hypothetical protein [Provencibacterium sp.]